MIRITLPKTFIDLCREADCDPQTTATEILRNWAPKKSTPTTQPAKLVLQNFIPPIVEALNKSINADRGPFKAKYYPPPNGSNTLWFHLTSVLSWWAKTYAEELDSPAIKKELQRSDIDYITDPKAINIAGKATWCYGFRQSVDKPIIPFPKRINQKFLEWTENSAPDIERSSNA